MPNTVLGKVSCVPRGDYSASATYTVLDIAGYQGGSYMALKTVTGVTPSNDGINWMQLSGPGLPGEQGEQGEPGAAAGFGQATATVDESTGTPSVDVTTSGPDTAKVFNFAFSGLKGETGAKGDKGDKGDTGATGPQGVSVIDAEINEAGHLVITLSAGEPIDAGNAVGPTGAKGDTGATGPAGASVSRIERTSGTGAPGTTDTYTVYLTDGSTGGTFQVYNGANGTGSGDFMADGTVPMSGVLQMGGNKITNLGAPGADTDAVRKQDLDAVAAEVDGILDGTTPAHLAPATTVKIGGVIVGDGLSVEADGTVSAESQLPAGGTAGQLLTKTADGEAWQDAPSGLPDGGTTGQILTQGANGPEWADAPDTGVTTFNNRSGAVMPQSGDYTADMVGARGSDWTPTADEVGAVPVSRTINGKALNANITLGAGDVGAVPTTTTVNGKALSGNISLTAGDVGAIANPSGGSDGQMLYKTASGAEWGIPPYIGSMAQLDFAQMKSLHALGVTDLNNVTEPGTYVGIGSGTASYPTISNIPSEVGESPFALNVYSFTGPADSEYTGSNIVIQECFGLSSMTLGSPKVFYRTGHGILGSISSWIDWSLPISAASSTTFIPSPYVTSNNVQDAIDEVQGNVDAAKPVLRTATLTASGWSSNSQTVTVSGVVANSSAQLIYVSPANKASATAWGEAGVFCSAQGANSLTFVCDSVPSANIVVNIAVQEAQT